MVLFVRKFQPVLLVLLLFAASGSVSAHSNLYRADPPPNAELAAAPELIHLYFTEALEPEFSGITLLREDGTTVETPPATVENFTEMTLVPGALPDGLYTVSWRALSSVDGHQTRGVYAFAIGQAAGAALTDSQTESIPPQDAAARWLTHISTALLIGGVGFLLFVWQPSKVARLLSDATAGKVSRRMNALILIGWLLYGVVTALSLLVYTGEAAALNDMGRIITGTRFGAIWLIRLGLWLVTGIALWIARGQPVAYIPALLISAALLYAQSQYSHSSATHDAEQTVLADWLHLLGTALWLGGLIHFFAVIPLIRGVSGALATLIGWFSNMARAALLALIATGAFLGFLFVGTPQALLTTLYGHALLIKLILIVPLIGIAGVNLILTARRLRRGTGAGSLRGLIGAEVALIGGVLISAAVMTSANPARAVAASREPIPDSSINLLKTVDDLHIHFSVEPGWVGENTYTVVLLRDGVDAVNDASLIRVRFEHRTRNLGESEVRPTLERDGIYTAEGANLSQPGEWRARVTVQRPGEFDAVVDFALDMQTPPVPIGLYSGVPVPGHTLAEVILGTALIVVGGFTIGRKWFRLWEGAGVFGVAILFVGIAFVVRALGHSVWY